MMDLFAPRSNGMVAASFALAACGVLVGCSSTSQRSPTGLVFPASVAQTGSGAFGRGMDVVDGIALNPFDPVALNNQAVAEAARGRYQHASSLLQRAVKLAPARADIASNLLSLQRWMAQSEGQVALGMEPQPLQLPLPEAGVPDVPPLWVAPPTPMFGSVGATGRPVAPAPANAVATTPSVGRAAPALATVPLSAAGGAPARLPTR
jgi:hypothetical protein